MVGTYAMLVAGGWYGPDDDDMLWDPVPTSHDPDPPMKLEHADPPMIQMAPIVSAEARP